MSFVLDLTNEKEEIIVAKLEQQKIEVSKIFPLSSVWIL